MPEWLWILAQFVLLLIGAWVVVSVAACAWQIWAWAGDNPMEPRTRW